MKPGSEQGSDTVTLASKLRHWALAQPDKTAVTVVGDHPRSITYADLDRAANRTANLLSSIGVPATSLVGLLGRNSVDGVIVACALQKARCALVGLNWRLSAGELAAVLATAQLTALFVDAEFATTARLALDEAGLDAHLIVFGPDRPIGADEAVAIETIGAIDFDAVTGSVSDLDANLEPESDDPVWVFYTSGTTGTPKGVVLDAQRAWNAIRRPNTWRAMSSDTINLVISPTFHVAGGIWVAMTLMYGGHLVLMATAEPSAILAALEQHRVTNALLVPTLIRMLVDEPKVATTDLSSVQVIGYGASPIGPSLLSLALETFPNASFVQVYGLSETGGALTNLSDADHRGGDPELLRSAGRALEGVELRVVDTITGAPVDPGVVGEIEARSDQNMVGYLQQPDETAAAFTADGYVRTGDAGFLDANGYLYLTDRIKDMIVSGGENVYPIEVDNVLTSHPDVAEAAAFGVPDEKWGETVRAAVVVRPGADLSGETLIDWCRQRLAHYKCPTEIDLVASLPRTAAGKVMRRHLSSQHRSESESTPG